MAEFTKEQRDILIETAEYMVKRENTSEYSENIRKVAEIALAALTAPQLPQPAVVDDDKFRADFERWMVEDEKCIVGSSDPYPAGIESRNWRAWNACRAAILQGAEPVSNRDEFPLDYLQGQKDGLEWAAQLAEANHPHTGDWLYDDPIALAAAIRKGPDMPEFKSVSVDEDDNFYSWFGRFWHENYQQNNYTTSAKQMLGTMAEFAYRAGRESAALASNSPVTPDGWVACSERMPEGMTDVHISNGHDVGQGWWDGDTWQTQHDYYSVPGDVTHWLSLPAAPQQEDL